MGYEYTSSFSTGYRSVVLAVVETEDVLENLLTSLWKPLVGISETCLSETMDMLTPVISLCPSSS